MKKTALFLLLAICFSGLYAEINDPVIMQIGGKEITKSEFEYIWKKNNNNESSDKKSLNEYIDLFVNFKLKVAEAEKQGIDTTKAFRDELNGYRSQLTGQYLTDKATADSLAHQAYDRMKEYVEASHILIKLNPDASPSDTIVAWKKINKIYSQAVKGEDFARLAKQYSDDGSKSEGGYLGFATGFRYVYPFENVMFGTEAGKISKPFRTQFGYHIIKVISRRPANGRYRSGHILKLFPPNATEAQKTALKDSIFKIYDALQKGGSFTNFAQNNSDDRGAASRGGEYGVLFCGSLPIEYEDAVYKLKVGEYSAPFQSRYGWHIVKALEFLPYPSFDEMKDNLYGMMNRDERAEMPKTALAQKLKKEYSFKDFPQVLDNLVSAWSDMKDKKDSTAFKSLLKSEEPVFEIAGGKYPVKLFASYIEKNGMSSLKSAYDRFLTEKILAYEDTQLEKRYPEFGHLMQEYHDGILLFDVSNKEVWDKAAKDTAGLENYFGTHKSDYAWKDPHFKGFVISCSDKKVASAAKKMLKKLPLDSVSTVLMKKFNTDSTATILVQRGLYAVGENPLVDSLVFHKKNVKNAEKPSKLPVVFESGRILKDGPEDYNDVRGLVISDYQNYLEKSWIEGLRKKYDIKINTDIVNTVNKD